MKHSIEVLELEHKQLTQCLSEWDLNHYPEARKERQKKLDDLDLCINVLKCVNDGVNPFASHHVYGFTLKTKKEESCQN